MTQALLEGGAGAPVQGQPMILILLLSVQAGQEEGRCEPAGLEPPLTAQMSPVFETEGTASVGVLQEQDVAEDSIVQEGGQVVVKGSLERSVTRLRELLARHLTDEVAANETVHSEHLVVRVHLAAAAAAFPGAREVLEVRSLVLEASVLRRLSQE
jgi:hypothetical protein